MRFTDVLIPFCSNFWHQFFSPNCAVGSPSATSFQFVQEFHCEVAIQLSNEMSSVILTTCVTFRQTFWEFCLVSSFSLTDTSTHHWIIASWNTFILSTLENDSAKIKIFVEIDKIVGWSQHVAPTRPQTWSRQIRIWKSVCVPPVSRKLNQKATIGVVRSLSSSSNGSILKMLPSAPTFWHKSTPIPVNRLSTIFTFLFCFSPRDSSGSLQMWEFRILRILLLFLLRTSARDSPTGSMSSPMGCYISVQSCRWTFGRTALPILVSQPLTLRKTLLGRHSHCGFLRTSLLGWSGNRERCSENDLSFLHQFCCVSDSCNHHRVPHRSPVVLRAGSRQLLMLVLVHLLVQCCQHSMCICESFIQGSRFALFIESLKLPIFTIWDKVAHNFHVLFLWTKFDGNVLTASSCVQVSSSPILSFQVKMSVQLIVQHIFSQSSCHPHHSVHQGSILRVSTTSQWY